jgi:hypothetical protein
MVTFPEPVGNTLNGPEGSPTKGFGKVQHGIPGGSREMEPLTSSCRDWLAMKFDIKHGQVPWGEVARNPFFRDLGSYQ